MSSESWSRSSSSRSRYDDRKRRDYDDRRRWRYSPDRDRRRGSSERDRYRSYDDRDSRREKSSRRHHRSRSRSRSSSFESGRRRKSHRDRSRSTEKKPFKSHKSEIINIKILRASRSRSTSQNKTNLDNDLAEKKNNYLDSFRTTNVDNSSIIGNIDESDFDREKIHKEMQERLSLHLAREGKVYPPPKPQASHPIFANDGSFLETFKKMQEQQQQVHDHKSELTTSSVPSTVQQQQYQKPMFSKRRGGKILKTGIVQKPKVADEAVAEEMPNDAWSLYLQEVKKYKNVSCDADSKTRPLVK